MQETRDTSLAIPMWEYDSGKQMLAVKPHGVRGNFMN
jgi:hypothetical protein